MCQSRQYHGSTWKREARSKTLTVSSRSCHGIFVLKEFRSFFIHFISSVVKLDGSVASDARAITGLLGVHLFRSSFSTIRFNSALLPIFVNLKSRAVRVELCCNAAASALAPESPMLFHERSRVVRVELCCSAVANAFIHEALMLLFPDI